MRIRAVALGVLLATSSVATAGVDPIIGGTPATSGEFPNVVAIFLGGCLCTGTLITPEWVLTAGHCVTPTSQCGTSNQAQVTAMTTVIFDAVAPTGSNGKQIKAMATMPDPAYDGALNNDVGLIHLATPVTDRTPAVINRVAASAPVGIHLQMVGYGVHTSGGNDAGVEYVLADKTTFACANTLNSSASDTNLLCWSQSDLTGKCEGDSGGPSFAMINGKKVQVGITSVGLGGSGQPTACDGSGADTRIDHVIAWLDSTIGDSLKCAADGVCVAGCANDPDCPKCTVDTDCTGTDQVCDHGNCVPAPLTPGGAGYLCVKDADCTSGMCGQVGTDHKCTETCDPTNNMCPTNFDCLASTATSGECWPGANAGKSESSCSAGNNSSGPAMFFLGIGAFLLTRRRRR